jgi:hypothetical protein
MPTHSSNASHSTPSSSPSPHPQLPPITPPCGAVGYRILGAFYIAPWRGYAVCANYYRLTTTCMSFSRHQGSDSCELFSIPKERNVMLDRHGDYTFYDRACAHPPHSSSTTITTTTTATHSSTHSSTTTSHSSTHTTEIATSHPTYTKSSSHSSTTTPHTSTPTTPSASPFLFIDNKLSFLNLYLN